MSGQTEPGELGRLARLEDTLADVLYLFPLLLTISLEYKVVFFLVPLFCLPGSSTLQCFCFPRITHPAYSVGRRLALPSMVSSLALLGAFAALALPAVASPVDRRAPNATLAACQTIASGISSGGEVAYPRTCLPARLSRSRC